MHYVDRYHDISCGHRVVGHESRCRFLHGHNYRIHFRCAPDYGNGCDLDNIGRVVDFSVVKEKLCQWVEENWDHKFLYWTNDLLINSLCLEPAGYGQEWDKKTKNLFDKDQKDLSHSFVRLPFNPTAENLAQYLVDVIGPQQLAGTGVVLVRVKIEETAKCHAVYAKEDF